MLILEEEGIKQSFKLILNTKGIIIKTRGVFASSYKEVYSRLYNEVINVKITNKLVVTEMSIDDNTLYFKDNDEANIIRGLLSLGKSNTESLLYFIGEDSQQVDIDEIDLEDVDDAVSSNRFNRAHPSSSTKMVATAATADTYRVGMSNSATLDHILKMRMKSIAEKESQTSQRTESDSSAPTQKPAGPPAIGVACFSVYAYIEGKQQGPYDEKQFAGLVQYGLVDQNTPIWKEGMSQWQSASSIPETAKFFQQTNIMPPPVLPKN